MSDNKFCVNGTIKNLVLQQGCNACTQNIYYTEEFDYDKSTALIKKILEISNTDMFSQEVGSDINRAQGLINVIHEDIVSRSPKEKIISSVNSLKNVLENAAGGVISTGIISFLGEMLK